MGTIQASPCKGENIVTKASEHNLHSNCNIQTLCNESYVVYLGALTQLLRAREKGSKMWMSNDYIHINLDITQSQKMKRNKIFN